MATITIKDPVQYYYNGKSFAYSGTVLEYGKDDNGNIYDNKNFPKYQIGSSAMTPKSRWIRQTIRSDTNVSKLTINFKLTNRAIDSSWFHEVTIHAGISSSHCAPEKCSNQTSETYSETDGLSRNTVYKLAGTNSCKLTFNNINLKKDTNYYLYVWLTHDSNSGGAMITDLSSTEATTVVSESTTYTYEVKYDVNGGNANSSLTTQTKIHGKDLTLHTVIPTRNSVKANEYTVNFNPNNGKTTKTSETVINTTKYTFQGWATSSSGSVAYASGADYKNDASVTLYAQWESATTNESVTLPTITECTRSGYELLGFATSSTATTAAYNAGASYKPTKAITLYAIWKSKGCIHIANSSGKYEMYRAYIANDKSIYEPYIPYIYSDEGTWVKCI